MQSFHALVQNIEPSENPVICKRNHCDKCLVRRRGLCNGCRDHYEKCVQKTCNKVCEKCGVYKSDVPGICCKSPVKEAVLNSIGRLDPKAFTKQPALKLPQSGITVVSSSQAWKRLGKNPYHPDNKVVAVALADALSGRGWYSNDMRDYCSISKDQKLILLTSGLDMVLERVWEHDYMGDPEQLKKVGFDYWMPIAFSDYWTISHYLTVFQYLRAYSSLQQCEAHYVPMYNSELEYTNWFQHAIAAVPNVVFNTQFSFGNEETGTLVLRQIHALHKRMRPEVTFSFVGVGSLSIVLNIKKVAPGRKMYFFSSNPWQAGVRGEMKMLSGTRKPARKYSRLELMQMNQKTYMEMCAKAPEDYGI